MAYIDEITLKELGVQILNLLQRIASPANITGDGIAKTMILSVQSPIDVSTVTDIIEIQNSNTKDRENLREERKVQGISYLKQIIT